MCVTSIHMRVCEYLYWEFVFDGHSPRPVRHYDCCSALGLELGRRYTPLLLLNKMRTHKRTEYNRSVVPQGVVLKEQTRIT